MSQLLLALWGIRTLRSLLRQVSLWQVKEYRLDRLRAQVKTPSVLRGLVHPAATAKWGFLLLLVADPALAAGAPTRSALTLVYALEAFILVRELFQRSFRRPRPTPKALGIAALTALLLTLLLGSALPSTVDATVILLALDRALPLLVAVSVLLFAPATFLQRSAAIRRATTRIAHHRTLTAIGVTGSFGKSSTKEFLATMLRHRFRVLKTPANVNTEIGIARVVLNSLEKTHDVFVCEMGAYRRGEIARSCAMVRPKIGILTAISDQHLSLFGSREAIAQAKGELLRSLPEAGTAIINGDDPACERIAGEQLAVRRILRYGHRSGADVRSDGISVLPRSLRLTIGMGPETAEFEVPLLGRHHVGSLLASAAAASAMGMTLPEIAEAASAIAPLPRTMEPLRGDKGTFVVDDTYSANPDGAIAAIEFLRHAEAATNVVVFAGMIELGRDAPGAHRRVGEALAAARADLALLTTTDYADDVMLGSAKINAAFAQHIVVETNPARALARLRPLFGADTVVLLEGRIPEKLRQAVRTS